MNIQLNSQYPCHFHPQQDAHFKCELCPNLICFKCIMKIYRVEEKKQGNGHGENANYFHTFVSHQVCPMCYHKHMINRQFSSELKVLFPPLLIISVIIIMVLRNWEYIQIYGLSILLFLGLMMIRGYIFIPYKRQLSSLKLKVLLSDYPNQDLKTRKKSDKMNRKKILSEKINNTFQITTKKRNHCPFCGKTIESDIMICPYCGENFKESKTNYLFCQQCGIKNELNQKICHHCGDPLDDERELRIINKEFSNEKKK